jgi:transcriptional regulator of arginine metabolism
MKRQRQALVLELVDRHSIGRQEELRARLRDLGVDVTQATLSRDIKELGLVKRAADGAYQRPDRAGERADRAREGALSRAVVDYLLRVEAVGTLVVVRTDPGEAQPLARAIDRAELDEVAGTLGGDDTILIVARDVAGANALVERFSRWAGRPPARPALRPAERA